MYNITLPHNSEDQHRLERIKEAKLLAALQYNSKLLNDQEVAQKNARENEKSLLNSERAVTLIVPDIKHYDALPPSCNRTLTNLNFNTLILNNLHKLNANVKDITVEKKPVVRKAPAVKINPHLLAAQRINNAKNNNRKL
jgi:hypothetical protein